MTIVRTDIDLAAINLAKGSHNAPNNGVVDACIMEWSAYLAGEPWSDAPNCVAPSIRSFCINWNDQLPDADRTRLLGPFVAKVIGTNTTPEDETIRAWMCCDWLVRTFTPAWLRKAGLTEDAIALESLPERAWLLDRHVYTAKPCPRCATPCITHAWCARCGRSTK